MMRSLAHTGRELERTTRVLRVVIVLAVVAMLGLSLFAAAVMPDTRPTRVGPAVQYSRDPSIAASRSILRSPLIRSVTVDVKRLTFGTVQGATLGVPQTASVPTPAPSPSRSVAQSLAPPRPASTVTEPHTSTSATRQPRPSTTEGPAVPAARGTQDTAGPTAQQWATLRRCESGDRYGNRLNPRYRGAYQIGFTEWQTYGGTTPYGDDKRVYTDPADAPPALQDLIALRLWQARGWQPWTASSKCSGLH